MINEKLLEGDLVSLSPISENTESADINPLRVVVYVIQKSKQYGLKQ